MIRGALCVICMDPDASLATLWADGKPIINTAAVTAVQTALKTALNSLRGMAKDCVEMTKNIVSSQETATGQTCAAAQELLAKIETESTPCATEALCNTAGVDSVTSAYAINGAGLVVGDAPTDARRILAATFTSSADGGAKATPDAAEDDNLVVSGDGTTASQSKTQLAAKESQQQTEGNVDWAAYNEEQKAYAAEMDKAAANSSILGALFMIFVTLFLL